MPNAVPTEVTEQLAEATRRLVRTADALTDDELGAPSGLPRWTRAHVVAHLALNAEALAGVLRGILEGRAVPMYPSQEARDADIEELAAATPAHVRSRLLAGCTELADAIAAVPPDRWDTTVERVPAGSTFPARAVPAMRLREVEIHHADLAAGYGPDSWPAEFAAQVLDGMRARGVSPVPFTVYATDLDRSWAYGEGGPTVRGAAADLAWWVTGRGGGRGVTSDDGALPLIEEW